MEIASILLNKECQVNNDKLVYGTCMMVTLRRRGDNGFPETFDLQFLTLKDLEILHNFVDKVIINQESQNR